MAFNYHFLLLCLSIWTAVHTQHICNRSGFDNNSVNAWSLFGLTEYQWPESRAYLRQYCSKVRNSTDFAKQYANNCVNGTSRTLMTTAANDFDRVNQAFCSPNGQLRNQLVSWSRCGNRAKTGTVQCWRELSTILHNVPLVRETQYRLPVICCIYYHWKWCNDNAIEQVSQCRGQPRKGFSDFVHNSTVNSMATICNQYEDSHNACVPYLDKFVRTTPRAPLLKNPLLYITDYLGNR